MLLIANRDFGLPGRHIKTGDEFEIPDGLAQVLILGNLAKLPTGKRKYKRRDMTVEDATSMIAEDYSFSEDWRDKL